MKQRWRAGLGLLAATASLGCSASPGRVARSPIPAGPPSPATQEVAQPIRTVEEAAPQRVSRVGAADVNAALAHLVTAGEAVGISAAVIDAEGTRFFSVGATHAGSLEELAPSHVFEVGSVTKVFTATLLAQRVARGELQLSASLSRWVPSPQLNTPITLEQLATQHAGLPRMPRGVTYDGLARSYGPKQLLAYFSQLSDEDVTKREYRYSNLGYGALGYALSKQAGAPLEQLVRTELLEPLQMVDTRVALRAQQRERSVPGHTADRLPARGFRLGNGLRGAAGYHSTTRDLAVWVRAHLEPPKGELGEALRLTQKKRGAVDREDDIGLGWHVRRQGGYRWHNGATFGFHSFIGFDPTRKTGVVLLSNTSTPLLDGVGFALLDRLAGKPLRHPKLREVAELPEQQLEDYVGEYRASPRLFIRIEREGQQLFAQPTGVRKFKLYPESPTMFFLKVDSGEVVFQRHEGRVVQLIYRDGARVIMASRVR